MATVLGANQYGKAENRVVRIVRDTPVHEIRDLNVSTSLRGEFSAAHTVGDQSQVLPTDTQKNTAFAYAKLHGVDSIEDYGLALGRRLLEATPAATEAEVRVEEYAWDRIGDHSFVRRGGAVRTAVITVGRGGASVESGVKELVVLNSTDSEFTGFLKDEFTTLPEADDRILATSLVATWRHDLDGLDHPPEDVDWNASYDVVLDTVLTTFAGTYSRALQETLYAMGTAVLEAQPGLADISFAAPNKHHFLVDFSGFQVEGLTNDGEVFIAADRPYGLIEATVVRTVETTREALLGCLSVPRFADDVLAGQPYAGRRALLAAADAAARSLTDAELDQALSGHPRIGERGGAQSQSEQAGVDADAGDTAARLRAGNTAYEARFDRVFLIRAAGRDAEQILAELDRRLGNDDAAERAETVDNLRQIALLRLEGALR